MQSRALFDQLRQKTPLVSVGALSADLMSLGSDLGLLEQAGVELLHFDVMIRAADNAAKGLSANET
jgi:hypothetical protein